MIGGRGGNVEDGCPTRDSNGIEFKIDQCIPRICDSINESKETVCYMG